MNNRKLAAIVSQVAMILIVIICALTCAFTQTIGSPLGAYNVKIADNEKQQTPPSNEPDFAWNNSKYFRSYDYIKAPDKRFFDWKSYTVTWDGKQAAIWGLYALSGVAHGIREAYHADPYLFERRDGEYRRQQFSEMVVNKLDDFQSIKPDINNAYAKRRPIFKGNAFNRKKPKGNSTFRQSRLMV